MDEVDKSIGLAAEMAAISAVKSEEIVGMAKEAADLDRFQNQLDNSKDRVLMVKSILTPLSAHDVTPELAAELDKKLVRSNIEIPPAAGADAVEGAEALGHTLMPQDYILTRLVGCESFLGDFYKKSREVAQRIGIATKDAYLMFTESQDSLEKALDILENTINTHPEFDGKEGILLGSRLFNLFKIGDKVNEDWTGNLSKLSRTISGISSSYYFTSKNVLNTTLSYFGGFADADEELGTQRFLLLPSILSTERFKECTYPNKRHSDGAVTAKQSVELMGGAYFLDVRLNNPRREKLSTVDDAMDYLAKHVEREYSGFENDSPIIFPKFNNEVKSLGTGQIKAVIKHLREVLKEWRKAFDAAEKFKLVDADYQDVSRGIYESSMPEDLKDKALTAFSALIRKNQMELLGVRTAVNGYLVLIVNGLIELCHDSIKANAP